MARTKITENNNWQENQGPAIVATGAAPSNATESAILINLIPGNYTAVVSGVNSSSGVALVEAYNIR